MLDIKYIRENINLVKEKLKNRTNIDLDKLILIDSNRVELSQQIDDLRNIRNNLSKEIAKAKIKDELLAKSADISKQIKNIEVDLKKLEQEVFAILSQLPNICDDSVPLGKSEEDNIVIRSFGDDLKNSNSHDEILKNKNCLDIERAVKISGSRFIVLTGDGAHLERALANFMLRENIKRGYTEYSLPYIVKRETMFNSGQLPKFEEDAYSFENNFLIPTSEVALINMFSKEILSDFDNKKMTAYTPCFRRESGSYGKDTKGLIRLHQFSKVEMVRLCKPEHSEQKLEDLVKDAENILQKLGLPYRVVLKCLGDTGFCAAKTYDLEVWMPSQQKYREISSCSNTRDFQSRRASIKFKDNKKNRYVHCLNGSGLAVGRTLAALVENYSDMDIKDLISKIESL